MYYFCSKDYEMIGDSYDEMKVLNAKIDDLITCYRNLKSDYENLKSQHEIALDKLQRCDLQIKELEIKNERYRLSGALLGDGGNAIEAKRKIDNLVREIDKCVALLNN